NQNAAATDCCEGEFEKLPEAHNLRAPKFIDFSEEFRAVDQLQSSLGNVTDEDGLKSGFTAANQRQGRRNPCQACETVEEVVFGTEDDGWPYDCRTRERRARTRFALGLAASILARGLGTGPKR